VGAELRKVRYSGAKALIAVAFTARLYRLRKNELSFGV